MKQLKQTVVLKYIRLYVTTVAIYCCLKFHLKNFLALISTCQISAALKFASHLKVSKLNKGQGSLLEKTFYQIIFLKEEFIFSE